MQSTLKDVTPPTEIKTKAKNTPSAWPHAYYCEPPTTPSSNSSCLSIDNDDFDMYTEIELEMEMKHDIKPPLPLQPPWPLPSCSYAWSELLPLLPWITQMNGKTIDIQSNEYTHNKNICVYNEKTGGECYKMEQNAKHIAILQNKINPNEFDSYLNHIRNQIFLSLNSEFYENILMYLDAESILKGLMMTCKKCHYFKFIDDNESNIWYNLLRRDFPKLFDDEYFLYIPYMNPGANAFENDILLRNEEKLLYFTKIKYDSFWSLIHFIKFSHNDGDRDDDNKTIKATWRDFKWSELLFGKYDKTNGLNAFKQLAKLRNHEYFVAFRNVALPDNDMIDYFCNAIRRYMPSGKAIIYLNPWIPSQRTVHWKQQNTKQAMLWSNEYRQCWAMPQDEIDPLQVKKIPPIIQLIGSMQFQNGKSFVPVLNEADWMPFLQSFNPNIAHISDTRDAWFQKQFMLNEMENRLKNIRTLVDIIM